jgi:serine/threonine-protein kinase
MRLEIGQILGGYEVVGVLGSGGMGSVYKVRNTISGRIDAMKILLPELRESSDIGDRFLNEIKVLANLSHPNIAALHTALKIDNQLLMIMEFIEGQDLDVRLKHGPLPIGEGVFYISQVLSALDYAHRRGVVHRDIKPANIAIQGDQVKLLDFGIARAGSLRLTRTGMVLGSLYYMSPEQVNGQDADARSDLYAVAATLYRVLTGHKPIDGESEYAVMRAQVAEMPVPPSRRNPAIPAAVSDTIMRGMMKDPNHRFQTAQEFQAALEPFIPQSIVRRPITPVDAAMTGRSPLPATVAYGYTGTTPIPSAASFNSAVLETLHKNLAGIIGPIAKTLVRKYSQTSISLPELCQKLAADIPNEAERRAFLKTCQATLGGESVGELAGDAPRITTPIPQGTVAMTWDPSVLDRARVDLAAIIGPVAKVIVSRAAKRARSLDELYSLITADLSQKDRDKFLSSRL